MVYVGPLVVKTVSLIPFSNPTGICITSDGAYAYVCCSNLYSETGQASIAKINLATNTVMATWTTPDGGIYEPRYVAVTEDGTEIYCSFYNANYVYIFDSAGGVITHLASSVPGHLRADSGTSCVYLCAHTRLSHIVVASLTLDTHYYATGAVDAFDFWIDPTNVYGWVATSTGGDLDEVVLPYTGTKAWSEGDVEFAGIVYYSPNDYLYVACPQVNAVKYYVSATGVLVGTISVGNTPTNIALTPDGTEIYVLNSYDNTVSVISTVTNVVTHTITFGTATSAEPWDSDLAITPDGNHVYVTSCFDNTISVISTSSHSVVAVIG